MVRRSVIPRAAVGAMLLLTVTLVGSSPSAPIRGRAPAGPAGVGAQGGTTGAGATESAQGAPAAPGKPIVSSAGRHDTSKPLRSVTPHAPEAGEEDLDADQPHPLPGRAGAVAPGARDPVVQSAPVSGPSAATIVTNFDGVTNVNSVIPPDTNGDVGPNHYVQWVNLSFAIYNRAGTLLFGPAAGSDLWNTFGGPCENTNSGDPIAQYDHLADRWVMSQFALPNYPNGPFYECVAVSTSGDPLGTWNRYEFKISDTKLDDYPHLGVWPDGYYMSVNQFVGNTWAGQGVVAFERARMLQGLSARMVYFDLFGVDPNLGGMLPSDLDGPAPPNGAPNVFAEADDNGNGYAQDQLDLWDFHVDWTTPLSSTFSRDVSLATAAMDTNLCGYARSCIPQPGHPTHGLDALSDRIMYRLQYRNFGGYRTLVTTQTVDVDGADHAGVRWFEVRDTGSGWAIRQQGTWAPDASDRWMGSAAMDGAGDIAVGYSVSSGSLYPSIRLAGRLAADPLGTLTVAEATIKAGSGSQTNQLARWGDYSMLAVDSADDCTFWYTNEYLATTSDHAWRTRIAAARLPGCGGGGGDLTPPSVSSFAPTTPSPTNASTIAYALTFDESVTGLAAGDFTRTGTATGCTVGAPSGTGAAYTIGVTGCSEGTVILRLNTGTVADLAANSGPTASSTASTVTIDRTAPSVSSLTPPTSPTSAATLSYGLTFDESVTGLAAGDFTRTGTATGCVVGAPSGSGASYTIDVSGCSEGTVILRLNANTVADLAANPGPTASVTAATVTIDRTGPSATLTAPSSPTNATTLGYSVGFSEAVTGLAAGDFTRTGSATGCVVGAPSGSGASYTVNVTGCSAGTVVLTLNAGSVMNATSNAGPATDVTATSVLIDRTAPTTGAPAASLRSGVVLGGASLPLALAWAAADTGGSGLATYDLARSFDGAAFVVIAGGFTSPSINTTTSSGHTYRFEVRAHDHAGNVGGWVAGPTLKPSLVQQTSTSITYHLTWTTSTYASFSGGSVRYATAAGASASYTFTGRSVAFVTTRAISRGAVKIYIDGVLATTFDCYAASSTFRYVAFARTWASSGTHTIKLVVVGTAGRHRVDLDAIEVER
jgi:hypothetical protein